MSANVHRCVCICACTRTHVSGGVSICAMDGCVYGHITLQQTQEHHCMRSQEMQNPQPDGLPEHVHHTATNMLSILKTGGMWEKYAT
jgi:hypothetical protein